MFRIVPISFFLILCFLLFSPAAYAQTSLYTIQSVEVDVTAENAIKARQQAFETAQQKAFKVLVERMAEDGVPENIKNPPLSTISRLIQDYEVTKEKTFRRTLYRYIYGAFS